MWAAVYVQMFDVTLANFVGAPPSLCIHSETCGRGPALEHNGDLYTCDHFVEPTLQAGQHPPDATCWSWWPRRRCSSSGMDKRDTAAPLSAASATSVSPATAAAPRTASAMTRTASRDSTTSVPASRRFFGHVTAPMRAHGGVAEGGSAGGRDHVRLRRRRMRHAVATTTARVALVASSSAATATGHCPRRPPSMPP